jgi:hypothetical protein
VISTPEVEIVDRTEERPYRETLLPIINAVWQANGYEETPFLHRDNGAWNPFKL